LLTELTANAFSKNEEEEELFIFSKRNEGVAFSHLKKQKKSNCLRTNCEKGQ